MNTPQAFKRTRIWTDSVGYNTLTLGSLASPLREQFRQSQGNVYARISICIHFETTMQAPKPSPVTQAPDAFFTTPRTYLARILCINCSHLDATLQGHGFKGYPEHRVRHPLNLSIRLSAEFRILEPIKVFDSDGCSILPREGDSLVRYLVTPSFVEISFVSPKFPERLLGPRAPFVCFALQFAPSYADVALPLCDIPAKIKLPQNPALADDGDGRQTRRADIDAHNRLFGLGFFNGNLSPEIDNEDPALASSHEAKLGKGITMSEQSFKPAPSTILFNLQTNALGTFEGSNTNNWVALLGLGKFSASRNIVVDNCVGEQLCTPPILPYAVHCFNEYLTVDGEFLPNDIVGGLM